MVVKARRKREARVASVAFEAPLRRMRQLVVEEGCVLRESLSADVALVLLFRDMKQIVCSQDYVGLESPSARAALMRAFGGMKLLVQLETENAGKTFVASAALVG